MSIHSQDIMPSQTPDHTREDSRTALAESAMRKFTSGHAHVAVIGLGYVGLPLALTLAESGYRVTGIDVDARKVESINQGHSYIGDITDAELRRFVQLPDKHRQASSAYPDPAPDSDGAAIHRHGSVAATTDYSVLTSCDAISICVPTPLRKTGDPDLSYIVSATESIATYLQPGQVIVLESTTYPGTTTEILLPALARPAGRRDGRRLKVGQDFFLAFSPERVDPGRDDWVTRNTPKVLGGATPTCLEVATAYYSRAIDTIVPVSSPAAAEMVKLFENTFRSVNIALANELLLMCDKLGLDAWEVLNAAATKPFGFMKFTPGPGLGGHCIPIDPHYLSWKMRTLDYTARFIQLASEVNTGMPAYWVQRVQDALNDAGKSVKNSRILVLGVAYKRDVSDTRESPALDIIHLLAGKGANVAYHDPFVPTLMEDGIDLQRVEELHDEVKRADCVIIVTDHTEYPYAWIRGHARLIIDTRHVL